eukprot:m.69034 g.69034  ORF g.69034 m.69034 type:complete len:153 (-) comp19950_c2_seq1:1195-1653(-)
MVFSPFVWLIFFSCYFSTLFFGVCCDCRSPPAWCPCPPHLRILVTQSPCAFVFSLPPSPFHQDLLEYEEEDQTETAEEEAPKEEKKGVKGSYVSIHSSGFRDFLLKAELLKAITDCGFEHPSEGLGIYGDEGSGQGSGDVGENKTTPSVASA